MDKRIANIVLFNDEKRILLQHRTDDAPAYPDHYGFFGGQIEEGETPEDAVKRECLEELNYELVDPKLAFNRVCDCKYGKREKFIFLERYDPAQKLVLNEGKGMKWIKKEEVRVLKIVDHNIEDIKDIFAKLEH